MADHVLSARSPDEILADIDDQSDYDLRDFIWEVINSVRDSYALALRGVGRQGSSLASKASDPVPEPADLDPTVPGDPLFSWQIAEIEQTVEDFLVNNYGDD